MYSLNNYIANIFKAYVKDETNNITFSNYIRDVPIEDDEIMLSFEVTSLYTNFPIIDTLNVIKDCVNNDDQVTRKTAISQNKFLDLVNLVLTTTSGMILVKLVFIMIWFMVIIKIWLKEQNLIKF